MLKTAFNFIFFEKNKSIGILVSIVISVFLVGQQLGIFFFLSGIIGGVVNNADPNIGHVYVINSRVENVNQLSPLDSRWVNQIQSIPGVKKAYELVMTSVTVKFDNKHTAGAVLIGSDFPTMAAGPKRSLLVSGEISDFLQEGVVSADFYDEKTFGHSMNLGTTFEINGKFARVGLTTKNAKGYSKPILYSTASKVRYFSDFPKEKVSAVIVTLENPEQANSIIKQINNLNDDIRAWTGDELAKHSVLNTVIANNMGISIGSLILFALISGFFIIGLTLYSSTFDRIKDYGTLKAIGATNQYITKLILLQGLIYAVVGFLISTILLFGMKIAMAKVGLLLNFNIPLLSFLFITTLIIAVGGASFSISKLRKVEPSSVFR